jgi:hypothetical protein
MRGRARRAGIDEPRVPVAGVVRDDVEDDLDIPLTRFANQLVKRVEVAERGLDAAVVRHVVAHVCIRRDGDRRQPDGVDPQPVQVIEPANDPAEVADAVASRVLKGARIDLVDHPLSPPNG